MCTCRSPRHHQEGPAPRVRLLAGAGVPAAAGAASQDPRNARRASGDVAEDQAQGRPAPRLPRIGRAQGAGEVQDHLHARVRLVQVRRAPRLAGAGTGAGHLPALLRPPRVRGERPAPGSGREERRPGHRAARRRPGARPQVLPHWILHGRRDHVELPQVHPAQAFGRSHPGPCGQLLVVRVPRKRDLGGLERAGGARQVGRGRGAPRALAHLLVEHPEAVPSVQRHRLQPGHHVPGGHGTHPQLRLQNLRLPGAAAGGVREPAPRHDGRLRQVELEPAGAGGPVPGRRGQGAPVARRRGPHRARGDVEVHRPEPAVGALPRAAHGRTPLPHGRRDGRRHRQVAAARRRLTIVTVVVVESPFPSSSSSSFCWVFGCSSSGSCFVVQ